MDETAGMVNQGREPRTYENDDWINVFDFQVTPHVNSETGERFFSVKLLPETYIEHAGMRLDVSGFRFTTQYEPALTFGEAGTPKAMRGIHFPDGWDITLRHVENVAEKGADPIFKEVDRIEGVTAKELAAGLAERDHERKAARKQELGGQAHDAQPAKPRREAEPAL